MLRRSRTGLLTLGVSLATACGGDEGNTDPTGTETEDSDTETSDTETSDTETETGGSCYDEMHAIVTDIDETLTTTDAEFLMQLVDSTYDPWEREGSSELMNDYHARGYTIVYMTARAETQFSLDDAMIPARDLTFDWLEAHGFPLDDDTLLVLSDAFVIGDAAATYKGQALMGLQAEGYMFDYAYGNANSDIAGFDMAGIPKDVTFIIGPEGGNEGTMAVAEDDWVSHRATQIPTITDYCEG